MANRAKRRTNLLSTDKYIEAEKKIRKLKPGEWCCYHEGFMLLDCGMQHWRFINFCWYHINAGTLMFAQRYDRVAGRYIYLAYRTHNPADDTFQYGMSNYNNPIIRAEHD